MQMKYFETDLNLEKNRISEIKESDSEIIDFKQFFSLVVDNAK